jgi:antitoxin (DNA-binding transcriptional repressor) of toxin-antitoxin stability system
MTEKSNKDVLDPEPALYAEFPHIGSKEARAKLPTLVDMVVDTGIPLIIEKLGRARAALVPARDLVFHEMFESLDMTGRGNINRPVDDLITELYEKLGQRLGLAPKEPSSTDQTQSGNKPTLG